MKSRGTLLAFPLRKSQPLLMSLQPQTVLKPELWLYWNCQYTRHAIRWTSKMVVFAFLKSMWRPKVWFALCSHHSWKFSVWQCIGVSSHIPSPEELRSTSLLTVSLLLWKNHPHLVRMYYFKNRGRSISQDLQELFPDQWVLYLIVSKSIIHHLPLYTYTNIYTNIYINTYMQVR